MRLYRKLPHFRLEAGLYFVTWRLHPAQKPLSMAERKIVADALSYFQKTRYLLWAWVVMDDHVHVLVEPINAWILEKIVHSWKSFTAHQILKAGHRPSPLWQREYFDRLMRNEQEASEKADYILGNPLKRWPEEKNYPWVWLAGKNPFS